MRDKLIDIILTAQGYKDGGEVPEYWQAVYQAEMESRRKAAGKIADVLLAAGVVALPDVNLPERGKLANLLNEAFLYGIQRHGEAVNSADANTYSFAADYLLYHGVTVEESRKLMGDLPKEE